jgi:hypothetical protein
VRAASRVAQTPVTLAVTRLRSTVTSPPPTLTPVVQSYAARSLATIHEPASDTQVPAP